MYPVELNISSFVEDWKTIKNQKLNERESNLFKHFYINIWQDTNNCISFFYKLSHYHILSPNHPLLNQSKTMWGRFEAPFSITVGVNWHTALKT